MQFVACEGDINALKLMFSKSRLYYNPFAITCTSRCGSEISKFKYLKMYFHFGITYVVMSCTS